MKKWYDNETWLRMQYIDKGLTDFEIAKQTGCSRETIRKLLIKYGIRKGK